MPNKNAEHIKRLEYLLCHPNAPIDPETIIAALNALKVEGRSPWRKVTKRHPGKRWEHARVMVALATGCRSTTILPSQKDWKEKGIWTHDYSRVTHWQPWPGHPDDKE